MAKFKFSDKQAVAILEMKLQSLANLERQKVEDELKEKQKLIKELRALLADPKKLLKVVKDELLAIREKYGDQRRTKVVARAAKTMSDEDLVEAKDQVMVLTKGGYVKRTDPDAYRAQKRGGVGVIDIETKEEDFVNIFVTANTHDDLLFFSDKGKVYQVKMFELPEGKKGDEREVGDELFVHLGRRKDYFHFGVSQVGQRSPKFFDDGHQKRRGQKTDAASFKDVRRNGITAIRLEKGRRAEVCQIHVQRRPFDNGDKKRPIHNVQRIRCPGDGAGGGRSAGNEAGRQRRIGRNRHNNRRRKRPIFPEYGKQRLRQKDKREKLSPSKKRRFGH